jgi:hypothetical protein
MWPFSRKKKKVIVTVVSEPAVVETKNVMHVAQARKVKQFIELGNTAEALKRAEYFVPFGIVVETVADCDAVMAKY